MEVSSFLSQIGLGNLDIGYILLALVILTIILIILNIVSLVKISNLKKRLRKFMKGKDVSFRFFNESLVERYNSYLVHKKLSRNSVSFYMRVLRAVYNKAVRQRLTKQSNPFENVYTGIDKTRKRSVGEFVISKLYKMKLPHDSSLELARDVFIFSFLTSSDQIPSLLLPCRTKV